MSENNDLIVYNVFYLYIYSCLWCDGLLDQSLLVDPFSYFSFQPALHNWCNKGHGMCFSNSNQKE